MKTLVSIKEIKKEGFKQIKGNLWNKGFEYYVSCTHCDVWTKAEGKPDAMGRIYYTCDWCSCKCAFEI